MTRGLKTLIVCHHIKILRLKQFIMDNFDFNLDLETWGLLPRKKKYLDLAHLWMKIQLVKAMLYLVMREINIILMLT